MIINTLIIYSEDSHDVFLLSILDSIKSTKLKILVLLPNKKKHRLLKAIDKDSKLKKFTHSNITFIGLKFLDSTKSKSKHNLILKFFNRVKKIILFFFSYMFSSNQIRKFTNTKKCNFISLENYSPLSNMYIKRVLSKNKELFVNIILVIHNTNNQLLTKRNFHFNFTNYLVVSNTLIANLPRQISSKTQRIPFSTPSEATIKQRLRYLSETESIEKIYSLVIVGEVSNNRRDYFSLLNFISRIKNPITLTLLGKVTDYSIIEHCYLLDIKPIIFDESIGQNHFDALMSNFDFILYRSSKNMKYSSAKASGIIFDSMRYGIPIISLEPLIEEFENAPSVFTFDENKALDLDKLITKTDRNSLSYLMTTNMDYLQNEIRKSLIVQSE